MEKDKKVDKAESKKLHVSKKSNFDEILMDNLIRSQEEGIFHTTIETEMIFRDTIRNGDIEALDLAYENSRAAFPTEGMGILSDDEFLHWKYTFIVSTTLARVAAVEGGMSYEMSCALSDAFIQELGNIESISDLYKLYSDMAYAYCNGVRLSKDTRKYSKAVQVAIFYISRNLHNSINLNDVASSCGYSTRYLSKKFLSDTGITLPDYIHQEKMKEACSLLLHTSLSVSEISAMLGYSSQSHFTEIFKSFYNVTPRKYKLRRGKS